ncbi:hypothetical protein [Candidatus Hamiltonella defensa]|uniref:hypothetical protein n=1 Tax=Candidatus Williamhamiltonella defendens TaxID=138072 RepID=UPI00131426DC
MANHLQHQRVDWFVVHNRRHHHASFSNVLLSRCGYETVNETSRERREHMDAD